MFRPLGLRANSTGGALGCGREKTVTATASPPPLPESAGASRIIVLNQGLLIEQGSHDELLADAGIYAAMYQTQVGGEDG